LLAARGARVLVNDIGVEMNGDPMEGSPGQAVVDDIVAKGGEAISDTHDVVTEAPAIVNAAVEAWGRVATHYEFNKPGAFDGVKGYEPYVEMQRQVVETEAAQGAARQGTSLVRFDTQPIGTPETVIERVRDLQRETGAKEITLVPQFGGMTLSEAKASLRLFAEEVLPVLQADPAPAREAPVPVVEQATA